MYQVHHHPRQSMWSQLCILLAVVAALASVRPTQAAMAIRLVKDINTTMITPGSNPSELIAFESALYFIASDGVHDNAFGKQTVRPLAPPASFAALSVFLAPHPIPQR
jgi:hypothetical protein